MRLLYENMYAWLDVWTSGQAMTKENFLQQCSLYYRPGYMEYHMTMTSIRVNPVKLGGGAKDFDSASWVRGRFTLQNKIR